MASVSPLSPLVLSAVVLTIPCYLVSLFIYRLTFHPLAKFPGPKLAAATKWYEFYFDILKGDGGQFMWEIKRLHKQYGPIVRINPEEIHIEDPEYYKTLYASNPTHRDKYPPAAHMAGSSLGTFGTVSHEAHRKRRAANSNFFSTKAIAGTETLLQEQVQALLDNLSASFREGTVLDLRVLFLAFSTDTVHRYALGKSYGLLDNSRKAMEWSQTIRALAGLTPLVKQFPWLISLGKSLPLHFVGLILPSLARVLQFHMDMQTHAKTFFTEKLYEDEAVKASKQPPTLFHCIYRSSLPPAEKAALRMAHEAFVIISAGSETTARSLSLLMYHLCANPSIMQKLRHELDEAFPESGKLPNLQVVAQLSYLSAIIKETLRCGSLITSRAPLLARESLIYKEWVIPEKTPVSLTMRDTLLEASIYKEPLTFDPSRWLGDSASDDYFIPFGNGTRMCQGMRFAYAEMSLAAAAMVRRFEFKLSETTYKRDIEIVRDCFVGETDPRSKGIRIVITGVRP